VTLPVRERRRVIVAEDDQDIRLLVELRLRRAGFDVTVAADGREALRLALSESPDLVVLDVAMPELDGLSVLDQIRANGATRKTPVVLLSASVHETQVETGLQRGASAYVKKPFALDQLLATIEQLLARR
jgi:DNA-binding response OmpR family regulator